MNFSELVGITLKSVDVGGDSIVFETVCGRKFVMDHSQDCSENVYVESVVGEVSDLVGSPILYADESSGSIEFENDYESGTWTFYKLATVAGWVDIRWCGESNGYYSESVDFYEVKVG